MQIFTLIPCVPFGIWAEMNTRNMRTLLRWDWQEALLYGWPRRNMPPTHGRKGKHHWGGGGEADCHHSTNTIKSDPPAKTCVRVTFLHVARGWYHGCSSLWGCELHTCPRVATWSTQLSGCWGHDRRFLPGPALVWIKREVCSPAEAALLWCPPEPPSQPAEARRSIAHYVFPHYRSSVASGVDGCLCDFRGHATTSLSNNNKKKQPWRAGAGSAGGDPGRCSIPSQHQQLQRYAAHPCTNDSRLGSVVLNNKIARVVVKSSHYLHLCN